jgi:hypothetical protein
MKKLFYLLVAIIFDIGDVYGFVVSDPGTHMNLAIINANITAGNATANAQLAADQAKAADDKANFIQRFVQGSQTLQAVVTGAQWAQSTVKGIQDQLSFFNDVRNYIESVEGTIQSVKDMYDTVANAYEDIDKTKTRWNRLMKGNYNDIKGIKEGLSEAASLADNLDDHATQLEQDAINVAQKTRMHDKALDAMIRKAKEINPLKAADPTVALLTKLEIQQNVELQRMINEKMFREDLDKLLNKKKRVESEKRDKQIIEDISISIGKTKADKTEIIF